MNPEQNEPEVKKTIKFFRPTWWLWMVIGVAAIAIITVLVLKFATKSSTATSATTTPDTTEEITIKQYLSSLRGDIVRYHNTKQTYEGWTADQAAIDQVKKMGSELKTQALTKDTYIIYAKMPSSKTIFCMDDKSFTGEITRLMTWAKACK